MVNCESITPMSSLFKDVDYHILLLPLTTRAPILLNCIHLNGTNYVKRNMKPVEIATKSDTILNRIWLANKLQTKKKAMLYIQKNDNNFSIAQSFVTSKRGDIIEVRKYVRSSARSLGFSKSDQTRIATAVSEICMNVVDYAKKGSVLVKSVILNTKQGLLIKITDSGPGILNISEAMKDGFSTHQRIGIGLPGSKRIMDVFGIESKPNVGTKVVMCKWVSSQLKTN